MDNIRDLICILVDFIPQFGAVHCRILSTIIYLLLRNLEMPYEKCRDMLKVLGLLSIQIVHSWVLTIIDEDDICIILRDGRKGHKNNKFYDEYPEIEMKAKAYAIDRASKKKSNFDTKDLANFVDCLFKETYPDLLVKMEWDPTKLIRSEESCRVDLLKWGAKFDKNKNRPYFEGHEREDVIICRKEFVSYFDKHKDCYFYPKLISEGTEWNIPLRKKRILFSHDESTYKSGEIPASRWTFPGFEPFFNKGRGRSIMLSLFIAMHDDIDIFTLNENEWKEALKKHPELDDNDDFLNYYSHSANAWIEPKKDHYFNHKTILNNLSACSLFLNTVKHAKGVI
jgi:hypothetical protein